MRPLLAITHLPDRELGLAGDVFDGGLPVHALHVDDGGTPSLDDVSGVIVMGGAMGVPDAGRWAFLQWELGLLREALERGTPTLGICLGAQLLATAAGGDVQRMDRPFVGWPTLERREAAAGDLLFDGLPQRLTVLEWHLDRIVPPPHAAVLAETEGPGCSVFRAGERAWGSQIHLEMTPAMLAGWLAFEDARAEVRAAGGMPARLRDEAEERLADQCRAGRVVFARFAELVVA